MIHRTFLMLKFVMDIMESKDDGIYSAEIAARTAFKTQSIVSFVRTHLPDIGPDDEEEAVSSDLDAFRKAMERLNLQFSSDPILGYEDVGDNKVSAWLTTNDPKLIVRATKSITETEYTPRFLSIHLMGENKLHELRSRVQQSLPTNKNFNLSHLLSKG